MTEKLNIHASCIALDNQGVLLTGISGCGKSDLALRLINGGAKLVSDDRTDLRAEQGTLIASAPAAIAGLIEVRQVGLLRMPCVEQVKIALVIELAAPETRLERMPHAETAEFLGITVRRLRLHPFEASTPAKIRAASQFPAAGA